MLKCSNALFLFLLFYTATFSANAIASDNVIICSDCESTRDFESYANAQPNFSKVLILNPELRLAKSYFVLYEPMEGKMLARRSVPSEVNQIFDVYHEFKYIFENMSHRAKFIPDDLARDFYTLSDPDVNTPGNYCGSYGSDVPDLVFTDACEVHDQCYTTSTSKSVCDAQFLADMDRLIQEHMVGKSDLYATVLTPLYDSAKDIYFNGVKFATTALEAYCNATPDPESRPECLTDWSSNTLGTGGGMVGTTRESFSPHNSSATFTYSCEVWSFPDGNGGRYLMNRNCVFSWLTPP